MFCGAKGPTKIFFICYVDDGFIAGCECELQEFIKNLRREFKITIKPASFFLGLEIDGKKYGSTEVSETHFIEKILECFNVSNCRPILTLIIKDTSTEENPLNTGLPYRRGSSVFDVWN